MAQEDHRDTATELRRSGGRPACRRAVASRPAGTMCLASPEIGLGSPGRQDAAVHAGETPQLCRGSVKDAPATGRVPSPFLKSNVWPVA